MCIHGNVSFLFHLSSFSLSLPLFCLSSSWSRWRGWFPPLLNLTCQTSCPDLQKKSQWTLMKREDGIKGRGRGIGMKGRDKGEEEELGEVVGLGEEGSLKKRGKGSFNVISFLHLSFLAKQFFCPLSLSLVSSSLFSFWVSPPILTDHLAPFYSFLISSNINFEDFFTSYQTIFFTAWSRVPRLIHPSMGEKYWIYLTRNTSSHLSLWIFTFSVSLIEE